MTDPKPIALDFLAPGDPDYTGNEPEPMRVIKGELYDFLVSLEARVSAVENIAGANSFRTEDGIWQVNVNAGAAPGGKQVTANNAVWMDATWLRFSKLAGDDSDMTSVLSNATFIYGRMKRDGDNWATWDVTGAVIDGGSYIQIPVSGVDSMGSLDAAQWQDAIVVFKIPV